MRLASCCRSAQILPDAFGHTIGSNAAADAIWRCEPFGEALFAAARVASSADNDEVCFFQTLRPVEAAVTIEMLNRRLSAASASKAERRAESATTIRTRSEFTP